VYEFMGGISATVRHVTGNDPDAYFSDMRNRHNPTLQTAKSAIWTETRTTLMNPKYIRALQDGGASSAETFAETFRNTYGWNVLKPEAVDQEVWEGLYDVYVEDTYNMDMENYFREKNPYALQEMSAVMLETIRKGYWDADQDTRQTLANLHATLVKDHEAGCSGFVCDNAKLRDFISGLITPDLQREYARAIDDVRVGAEREPVEGMKLEKETLTLDSVKRMVQENVSALIVLFGVMILFATAIVIGARRRR
jgi:cobaltochelatase CobN